MVTATLACTLPALGHAQQKAIAVEGISADAIAQIGALLADKEQRNKAQQKLDSHLIYGARMADLRDAAPGVPKQELSIRFLDGADANLALVDITTNAGGSVVVNDAVAAAIASQGGTIINNIPQFNAIRAALPLAAMEMLAGMAEVRFIAVASTMQNDTGSVTSEGDRTLGADTARSKFPINASSVGVCVLSDSATAAGIANSVANGNFAAGQVTVLPGQNGAATEEGLAMLEIVNDVAPGAKLFFATAGPSEAGFAQNIINLRNTYGCEVMVDDIRYGTESPFQDSVIARAVNTVTASGALYFASAGNSGNKADGTSGTWVGDFVNGGALVIPGVATSYEVHSFQSSPSVQNYNTVLSGGSSYALSLFWSDPEGGSTNDYDVFQLNAAGTTVISSSTTTQNGTQNPYESATLAATAGNRVVVVRKTGAADRALYVSTGRGRLSINTNGFARGHSAAIDAIAVAAVPSRAANGGPFPGVYSASQTSETFSSDGPARKFFNPDGTPITPGNFLIGTGGGLVQQYPILTAPDGVTTTVFGFDSFFGTSAAAPHAAAVAALLKAYRPSLTAAQIRTALVSTALDIEVAGVDVTTGAGIIRPVNALTFVSNGPQVAGAGATGPTAESFGPASGGIDPGETVTVNFGALNVGTGGIGNAVGTLLAIGGVTFPVAPQNFGALAAGGASVARAFTFTADPLLSCGANILATVAYSDGATNLGNISYSLQSGTSAGSLPVTTSYTGPAVAIPDNSVAGVDIALPVSGILGAIGDINFVLNGLPGCNASNSATSGSVVHTFIKDLSFRLTSPAGTTASMIVSRGGGGDNLCTLLLDDEGAFPPISTLSAVGAVSGNFTPDSPLAVFRGENANGNWILNVSDNAPQDTGFINRFSLIITGRTCSVGTPPPIALLGVQSRKAHGNTGTYQVTIDTTKSIADAVTVEPRAIGAGHTVAFNFDTPIFSTGTVSVSPVGSVSAVASGSSVVVTLTDMPDNRRATISLLNVNGVGVNAAASIGFLMGDVSQLRSVNASDISTIRARNNQIVTNANNFIYDINADGVVNSADIAAVKSRSGLVLP